jgi:hypothetical protein
MQVNNNEVYSIKISNGDELVAKLLSNDDLTFTVGNPLTVIPGPQGLQLMPSLFTADPDGEITINISNISMIAVAHTDVRDRYIEATSGITPVRNKVIMG